MILYLRDDLKKYFSNSQPLFDQVMALRGQSFRHQEGRLTQRIVLGGDSYFLKQHTGVGYKEIIKNILQLRWPVISAKNEWQAIQKLNELGVSVPVVAGYGLRGLNPARLESFVLMQELKPVISLEELCLTWRHTPPSFVFKCELIKEVARMTRLMHENGMNHRDFYICHFLLNTESMQLSLIDLHRAQIRCKTPQRWVIKDLAGLYFSSKDIGLKRRDYYRFMKAYRGKSVRDIMRTEGVFWKKVIKRGEKLYRDHR